MIQSALNLLGHFCPAVEKYIKQKGATFCVRKQEGALRVDT